jgi:undecaprenyl-diphosphatase
LSSRGGRVELAVGLAGFALAVLPTTRSRPPRWELDWFRAFNGLPDELYRPVYPVMQFGALGAAPATAAIALAFGDRPLATRLLVRGSATWLLAKAVKRVVRRGRPATVLTDVRFRGQEQRGGGFPSGHAGVAAALASTALLSTGRQALPVLGGLAVTVALARVYVGAHLPLDVLGGAALGVALDGILR